MPRRGIPYDDVPRAVAPSGLPDAHSRAEFTANVLPLLPTGGVGLPFMAYNSKLDRQFVVTQHPRANNVSFPIIAPAVSGSPGPGLDGVIGRGPNVPAGHIHPRAWDDLSAGTAALDFNGFVHLKGGECFFAPSLKFLRNL